MKGYTFAERKCHEALNSTATKGSKNATKFKPELPITKISMTKFGSFWAEGGLMQNARESGNSKIQRLISAVPQTRRSKRGRGETRKCHLMSAKGRKCHSLRIYPHPHGLAPSETWSETMVSIPLRAQKTLEIKGFLGLERPFLDLVSQTPRPRGRG